MDHVRELQGRLFAVAITFVVFSAAAYPFFDKIVNLLVAPLGKDNELVYLTPGGAFSFIIKVCMYIGFIASLPVIIYHFYRFIMPVMKQVHIKRVLLYTVASFVLALTGIAFAYVVSLPAALYFLTGFDLYHINPMLTIDSYFAFIMTYMLAGALLFQIPLVMMIADAATPLPPKKLMGYQGHILIGSFIIAALISPTPDALNQALLASPMVVMYQIGIVLLWVRHRRKKHGVIQSRVVVEQAAPAIGTRPIPVLREVAPQLPVAVISQQPRSVDGMLVAQRHIRYPERSISYRPKQPVAPRRQSARSVTPQLSMSRSLDGFIIMS